MAGHDHAHGDPHLAHHFESPDQQFQSAKLGMWIFLVSEVLLFGGLFCAYAVYRANHPEVFVYAHRFLNATLGGVNTLVLICSSLTMAWAVRAAQLRQGRLLRWLLSLTLLLACAFLGIKYVEYKDKWEHGLLWASRYAPVAHHGDPDRAGEAVGGDPEPVASEVVPADPEATSIPPAPAGPSGLAGEEDGTAAHASHDEAPGNVQTFFSIYFLMTGLHGLHVLAGMAAISWLLRRALRGDFESGYFTPVDLVGLYWHLVDLIWIYLFPLLYLIH